MFLESSSNQVSHQRHWAHSVCIGMLPHKNTSSRLQYLTVSPKFIEAEKVKQNEKAEELLTIERAREKHLKK